MRLDRKTIAELSKLDTGEEIALRLSVAGASTRYLVIREDKFYELATKAGYERVQK